MHSYAVDSDERKYVAFLFAALSIGLVWVVQAGLAYFAIFLPWFFCVPSPFGVYGILWLLFDRLLWKSSVLHSVDLIKTPNLSGKWHGVLLSSHDDYQTEHKIKLEIHQKWTGIELVLRTHSSSSQSEVASVNTKNPNGPVINYQYLNDPNPNTPESMHMHRGTTVLRYDASKDTLEGNYYTDGKRKNDGPIHLEREKNHQ